MRICSMDGCDRPFLAKGYCSLHYERLRSGRPLDAKTRIYGSRDVRFWAKVLKSGGCWEWTAGKNRGGYGVLGGNDDGPRLAHRISCEIHHGPIPDGLVIDHKCHNRGCVNPDHLRAVTFAANVQNRSGATRSSRSGVRGVRRYRDTDRWVARGQMGGKYHHIGYFDSLEAAAEAVSSWRQEHMPYSEMDKKEVADGYQPDHEAPQ